MTWTSHVNRKHQTIISSYTSKHIVVTRKCGLPTTWSQVCHPRAACATTAAFGRALMFSYFAARPHDAAESRVNGYFFTRLDIPNAILKARNVAATFGRSADEKQARVSVTHHSAAT